MGGRNPLAVLCVDYETIHCVYFDFCYICRFVLAVYLWDIISIGYRVLVMHYSFISICVLSGKRSAIGLEVLSRWC